MYCTYSPKGKIMARRKKTLELKKTVAFTVRMTESFNECWSELSNKTRIPKTQLLHWAMVEMLAIEADQNGIYVLHEGALDHISNNFKK